MLLSSVVAMFGAVVNGFDISMLPKGFNLDPAAKEITSLLNRGSM